jgi:autophagy-related protein 9
VSLAPILVNFADPLPSTMIFVAVFVTFLTQCVDYSKIPHSTSLSQVLYPQCTKNISGMPNLVIWLFSLWVCGQIYSLVVDIPRLMRLHDFFLYLLEVPDSDIQTVSWQEIVARLMALRDSNPITVEKISPANRKFIGTQSKQRLDAHDIANRLMRRENYFIALLNKEVLDLTLPLPFLQGRQLFSKTLYWNLNWCIMDFIFNERNQVNQLILKDSHRRQLSDGLRDRFLFAAFMNVIFAPVIVMYLLTVYFLKYFNVGTVNTYYLSNANVLLGVPKEPCVSRSATIHSSCRMEISRVQRSIPSLRKTSQHVISLRLEVS